jgi:acyl carrier protein
MLDEVVEAKPGTLQGPELLLDVDGWDSVAVMGFIALVDEQFEITLAPKRIAACKTVNDLLDLVSDQLES